LSDVIELAKEVAQAAGGFFGLGRVAAREAEAIEEIATALSIEHHHPWVAPEDATIIPIDADSEGEGPAPEITFHVDGIEWAQSRGTLVRFDELKGEQICPVTAEGAIVGRGRECEVQISYDGQVSRKHCRVFVHNGRFYVADLGSTCGTWVNGERIAERRLLGGEKLHVGSAEFFFQLSPSDDRMA
jgi:FHA domain-containing protein